MKGDTGESHAVDEMVKRHLETQKLARDDPGVNTFNSHITLTGEHYTSAASPCFLSVTSKGKLAGNMRNFNSRNISYLNHRNLRLNFLT